LETSTLAYHELEASGQLGAMQQKVLNVFYERPDRDVWSNREIAAHLGLDACNVTGRTYELRGMGILEYAGKKRCSITERWVRCQRLATTIRR